MMPNMKFFVEQAKAKAKAIEYEAELILKDAKIQFLMQN